MARLAVWVGGALLVFASAAVGQQEPDPQDDVLVAGGFPPLIGVVEGIQGDRLILRQLQVRPIQEKVKVPVEPKVAPDGTVAEPTEFREETITRMKPYSTPFACDLNDVLMFDTNGQPIPPERVPSLFVQPRMVLMTFPGFPVDPAYLKVARDGTPFLAFLTVPPPPNFPPPRPNNAPGSSQPGAAPAPSQAPPPAPARSPAPPPAAPTTNAPAQPTTAPAQPAEPSTAPAQPVAPATAPAPPTEAPKAAH